MYVKYSLQEFILTLFYGIHVFCIICFFIFTFDTYILLSAYNFTIRDFSAGKVLYCGIATFIVVLNKQIFFSWLTLWTSHCGIFEYVLFGCILNISLSLVLSPSWLRLLYVSVTCAPQPVPGQIPALHSQLHTHTTHT